MLQHAVAIVTLRKRLERVLNVQLRLMKFEIVNCYEEIQQSFKSYLPLFQLN